MTGQLLRPGEEQVRRVIQWFALRPGLTLVLAVLAALGPFLTKPLNVDDPLFLWAGRQIQTHPANPYGFDLNWYGFRSPMWEVTKNPPLACYYLALAASVLGWSEAALHFALLLPAVAAILGTYRLARRFCQRPLFAASVTLFTPVFLVSSTTLMCDTLLLALWVWAVVFWVEGMERGGVWSLAGSGLLMALAVLTKYFGACLIPLLFVYSLVLRRRLGRWAGFFLIPIVVLCVYQWGTHALYGKGLLSDAGAYAAVVRGSSEFHRPAAGLTALAFTGGCLAVVTLFTPWLWRPRMLGGFLLFVILATATIFRGDALSTLYGDLPGTTRWWLQVQVAFWAIGGVSVLALAAGAAWSWRDAPSGALALWVCGTILFAGFFNWTVNARSILPMAPAVAILLARRLTPVASADGAVRRRTFGICLLAGGVLALAVARADFLLAKAACRSAQQTYGSFGHGEGTLWFEGHWGFQYYLERLGSNAQAVETGRSRPKQGDLLAIPLNNCNVSPPDSNQVHPWKELLIDGPLGLTTIGKDVGAGFYASAWGPLPFAFGRVPPDRVLVYFVGQPPSQIQADPPP